MKPFGPQRWLAFIVFVWGVLALCTGFVQNFGQLVALRVLLGAFEAGLFPGLNVYLTFFYTKRELALRVGYLFVSAAVAGALGGLLAYGIGHLDGVRGMSGWRWIMIIEGLPTILLGFVTFFLLPNDPEHAYFLTPEEKKFMVVRTQRHYGSTTSAQQFSKEDMVKAFKDWKVWLFCIGQFGCDTMLYGKYCAERRRICSELDEPNDIRLFDFSPDYYQRLRFLVDGGDPTAHDSMLRSWRNHVHDNRLHFRSKADSRIILRNFRFNQHHRLWNFNFQYLGGRPLFWVRLRPSSSIARRANV